MTSLFPDVTEHVLAFLGEENLFVVKLRSAEQELLFLRSFSSQDVARELLRPEVLPDETVLEAISSRFELDEGWNSCGLLRRRRRLPCHGVVRRSVVWDSTLSDEELCWLATCLDTEYLCFWDAPPDHGAHCVLRFDIDPEDVPNLWRRHRGRSVGVCLVFEVTKVTRAPQLAVTCSTLRAACKT